MQRFRKEPKIIDDRAMKDYISLLIDIEKKTAIKLSDLPDIRDSESERC